MKIGIFGGTFNPPHLTHVNIAKKVVEQLNLDKLLVVPCGEPYHKPCHVDKDIRLALTRLAFDGIEGAEVWDYEINKQGASYTVDTLHEVKRLYPNAELYLVIGGDSLRNIGKWKDPEVLTSLATLVLVDRNRRTLDRTVAKIEASYNAAVVRLDLRANKVSSHEIRLRYQFGQQCLDVPASVNEYILANGLYSNYRKMSAKAAKYLTPERLEHTFYVVKRGTELVADEEYDKAFTACLLHDVAKYIPQEDYAKYGFVAEPDMPTAVVHSFLGAKVAERDFGVKDREILDAIAYHTTGRPNMTRLDKIVYVADKTEQTRPYPLSHLLRGSLNNMFLKCLIEANEYRVEAHGDTAYRLTDETLEYYLGSKEETKQLSKDSKSAKNRTEQSVDTYAEKPVKLVPKPHKTVEDKPKIAVSRNAIINATALNVCKFLSEKSAVDIRVVDMAGLSDLADNFVICSGRSAPQVKALFDHLEEQMEKLGKFALHKEGMNEGRWIAIDYGDVIVHIFHKDTREMYNLDTLWNNGNNVTAYDGE